MNRHSVLLVVLVAASCRCGERTKAPPVVETIERPVHETAAPEVDPNVPDPLPPGAIARIGTHRLHHGGPVTHLALTKDGTLLASAGVDETVALWSVKTGRLLHRFEKARGPIAFDEKGETLAAAGTTSKVRLLDTTSGADFSQRIEVADRPRFLRFSSDGNFLEVGAKGTITKFELATQRPVGAAKASDVALVKEGAAKLEQGELIVSALPNGAIVIRSAGDDEGHTTRRDPVRGLEGRADGTVILSAAQTRETWKLDGAELVDTDVLGDSVAYLGVLGDHRIHIGRDGHVATRDMEGERRDLTPEGCEAVVLTLSRDSKRLAIACADRSIRIVDVASAKQLASLEGPPGAVRALDFAPGAKVLAASVGELVRLYALQPRPSLTREIANAGGPISALSFSPDGKQLATVDDAGVLRIWILATGNERWQADAHDVPSTAIVWSRDGRYVATGARDGSAHVFDAVSGGDLASFAGHLGEVTALAFVPGKRVLLTGGADGTVLVWPHPRQLEE